MLVAFLALSQLWVKKYFDCCVAVAPWLGAAAVVQTKEKSLKEIQEEEERQLRAEQAQQARLRKEVKQEQ